MPPGSWGLQEYLIWVPQVLGEHSRTIWGESGFYGLKIWESLYAGRVRYWQFLTHCNLRAHGVRHDGVWVGYLNRESGFGPCVSQGYMCSPACLR